MDAEEKKKTLARLLWRNLQIHTHTLQVWESSHNPLHWFSSSKSTLSSSRPSLPRAIELTAPCRSTPPLYAAAHTCHQNSLRCAASFLRTAARAVRRIPLFHFAARAGRYITASPRRGSPVSRARRPLCRLSLSAGRSSVRLGCSRVARGAPPSPDLHRFAGPLPPRQTSVFAWDWWIGTRTERGRRKKCGRVGPTCKKK